MSTQQKDRNSQLVLEAFDALFNRHDFAAAERYWSPNYIQHSAHIPPGRDGLFEFVKALPADLRYENAVIVTDGNYVIAHGRFSSTGLPANMIAADIIRMEDGLLAEHWDVITSSAATTSTPTATTGAKKPGPMAREPVTNDATHV